jgi:hypothetical protein
MMDRSLKIFLLILPLFLGFKAFSQPGEKLEALRAAFITKKLELTVSEAEKFWPVYNEYSDKLKAIKRNLRQNYKKHTEAITDAEAEELFKLDLQSRQAETDLHKQYSERIRSIIGVKKTIRLRLAEEEFKKQMIENIRDKGD